MDRQLGGVVAALAVAVLQSSGCSVFPESPPEVARPAAGGADGGNSTGGTGGAGGTASDGGSGNGGGSGATASRDASLGGSSSPEGGPGDAGVVLRDASPVELDYVAAVADCLEEVTGTNRPNPDACLAYAAGKDGPNELWVDLKKGSHRAFTAYLRFDLDGKLDGRRLVDARVDITVTAYPTAGGNSASLWECAPFARASLFVQAPALLGTTWIAPAQGVVSESQTVSYRLPLSLLTPSSAVYLALVPVVATGSGYWSLAGASPPRLVVTYR